MRKVLWTRRSYDVGLAADRRRVFPWPPAGPPTWPELEPRTLRGLLRPAAASIDALAFRDADAPCILRHMTLIRRCIAGGATVLLLLYLVVFVPDLVDGAPAKEFVNRAFTATSWLLITVALWRWALLPGSSTRSSS